MGERRASGSSVSVYEAAEVMGVTVDDIRVRISENIIPHEYDGRVWVILGYDQNAPSKKEEPPARNPKAALSYP
jgi:hypothetical protein